LSLSAAKLRGFAEGRSEGRSEERQSVIQNMRARGLTDEAIAEFTGYALDDVMKS